MSIVERETYIKPGRRVKVIHGKDEHYGWTGSVTEAGWCACKVEFDNGRIKEYPKNDRVLRVVG